MEQSSTPYGVIYVVTHEKEPERVRYVGQTTQPLWKRAKGHWYDSRRSTDTRMARWLNRHSKTPGKIHFTAVSEHEFRETLDQAEIEAIAHYRSIGQADLNIDSGGWSGGHPWTEESKARLRATLKGEGAWKAKITWADVAVIRERYNSGEELWMIQPDYPLTRSSVSKIVRNETWVDTDYTPRPKQIQVGDLSPSTALTRDQAFEMRDRAMREVKTYEEWGQEYGVSKHPPRLVLQNLVHHDPNYDPSTRLTKVERRPLRKLNRDQVREIRELRMKIYEGAASVGRRYNVTGSAIANILKNRTWYDPEFDPNRVVPTPQR